MSIKMFDLPDLEGVYVEYWPFRTARVMGRTHTADRNSLHRFEERLREMVGTRGVGSTFYAIYSMLTGTPTCCACRPILTGYSPVNAARLSVSCGELVACTNSETERKPR